MPAQTRYNTLRAEGCSTCTRHKPPQCQIEVDATHHVRTQMTARACAQHQCPQTTLHIMTWIGRNAEEPRMSASTRQPQQLRRLMSVLLRQARQKWTCQWYPAGWLADCWQRSRRQRQRRRPPKRQRVCLWLSANWWQLPLQATLQAHLLSMGVQQPLRGLLQRRATLQRRVRISERARSEHSCRRRLVTRCMRGPAAAQRRRRQVSGCRCRQQARWPQRWQRPAQQQQPPLWRHAPLMQRECRSEAALHQ